MFYVLCIISCPPNWLSKLALSAGSTAGRRGALECGLAEGEMHTTTCPWCKPIEVRVQTTTRSQCRPIVVHASTNSGRHYLLTVVEVKDVVASVCGRTCAFSRHSFR